MNIASFHELRPGGAKRVAEAYAIELQKRGHNVDYYYTAPLPDPELPSEIKHPKHISFLPAVWNGNNWKAKLDADIAQRKRLQKLHQEVATQMSKEKYDVVLVHPSQFTQTPFLLRFLTVPSAYYCQEPLRLAYDTAFKVQDNLHTLPLIKRTYEQLNRAALKKIDHDSLYKATQLLCSSNFMQEAIQQAYGKHAIVCPLGVDTHMFKPKKRVKRYDILFVGEKSALEGYDLFTGVLQQIGAFVQYRLVSGNASGRRVSDEDLSTIYNQSKLVLAFGRNEPFGLIPLEAMACGVPVIAINEGGYRETIQHLKSGVLVEPRVELLSEAIMTTLKHPKAMTKMSRYARALVETHWTWNNATDFLERALATTVGEYREQKR